jgi:hypothetical protein
MRPLLLTAVALVLVACDGGESSGRLARTTLPSGDAMEVWRAPDGRLTVVHVYDPRGLPCRFDCRERVYAARKTPAAERALEHGRESGPPAWARRFLAERAARARVRRQFGPTVAGAAYAEVPLWAGPVWHGHRLTRVDASPSGAQLKYGDAPVLLVSREWPDEATISGLNGASELVNRPPVRRLGQWWVTAYGAPRDVRQLVRDVRPVPRR